MTEKTPNAPVPSEVEKELYLLNHCLASAEQVHFFVTNSLRSDLANRSLLLESDTQHYLTALLDKYSRSAADRKQLRCGTSLYYLECLTDPHVREDFITLAASPMFPGISYPR